MPLRGLEVLLSVLGVSCALRPTLLLDIEPTGADAGLEDSGAVVAEGKFQ